MHEVSILIPAFQAETFIDRTLHFARGQTHDNIRILVSLDQSNDGSADRITDHARQDARIEFFEQPERLGWVGNVNFLLSKVTTPYFFIYFHDDIILPQYTEKLLSMLLSDTNLASAHCDMGHFGTEKPVSRGRPMLQDGVGRLLDFMLNPSRSSPLRSMIRSDAGGYLRLPRGAKHGLWANEPFLLDLFSAGPAGHVQDTLYLRWDLRQGGMTHGWTKLPAEEIAAGWRTVIDQSLAIIARSAMDSTDIEALSYALYLKVAPTLLHLRRLHGGEFFPNPTGFHAAFAEVNCPVNLDPYGPDIQQWAADRWSALGR